jgi:hypothetical protein
MTKDVIIHMVRAHRWADQHEIQAGSCAEIEPPRTSDHRCDSHANSDIFCLAA